MDMTDPSTRTRAHLPCAWWTQEDDPCLQHAAGAEGDGDALVTSAYAGIGVGVWSIRC